MADPLFINDAEPLHVTLGRLTTDELREQWIPALTGLMTASGMPGRTVANYRKAMQVISDRLTLRLAGDADAGASDNGTAGDDVGQQRAA